MLKLVVLNLSKAFATVSLLSDILNTKIPSKNKTMDVHCVEKGKRLLNSEVQDQRCEYYKKE